MTTLDVDELIQVAKAVGLTLRRDEAEAYRERILRKVDEVEAFMRSRIAETRPAMAFTGRSVGHAPTGDEDPYNAWLWKCEIKGAASGILAGKTVGFKDNIAVAGVPLTLGSYLLEGFTPDFDATVVSRVLAAGATVIGKHAMNGPTNAWGAGVPSDYPRTLNPHAPDHLTGGSSSGSAAAVAAGEVDIAFGGDQGGSIRIPAAYCGVYGLKPTFGLVSHFGIGFGAEQSVDHAGPLGRRIEDVAAAFDAVAGYDGLDPRQDRSVPAAMDTLTSLGEGVKGVRIGILDEGMADAAPDVRDAVVAALDILATTGARITHVSIPEQRIAHTLQDLLEIEGGRAIFDIGFFGAFNKTYYPATFMAATYRLFHEQTDRLRPKVKLSLIVSELVRRRFHGQLYAKVQNARAAIRKAFDSAFDEVDVLAMPTCMDLAPRFVEPSTSGSAVTFEPEIPGAPPRTWSTSQFNYTGHPALTVPCGKSGALPIGLQLVGPYYAEALLFRTAFTYQHSVDWEGMTGLPVIGDDPAAPSS